MRPSIRLFVFTLAAGLSLQATGGDSRLLDAVRGDNRAAVATALADGAEVNAREGDGSTALAWAAMRSNVEIARLLLEKGADPNLANELGIGPLALATRNGSPALASLLLERGADADLARENGETALMTAARLGQIDVMRMLLDHGADPNAREKKFGQTPLMWAAGHPEAVRLLLERGADPRLVTKQWEVEYTIYIPTTFTLGKTGIPWNNEGEYVGKKGGQNALFFAVQARDLESARALADAGVDVNESAADGTTPLLLSLFKWAPLNGDFVPGRGAPARAGSSQQFAPQTKMAEFLLDRGASPLAVDGAGYTPLHGAALAVAWATRSEDKGGSSVYRRASALLSLNHENAGPASFTPDDALGVVRRLLKGDADPNRQTLYPTPGPAGDVRINPAPPGSSALHIAANSGSVELIEALIAAGADPNLLRKDGHTPFSVSVVAGDLALVKQMVAGGADVSLHYNPDDKIPDPYEAITLSRRDQTILHIAAATLNPEVVEYLDSVGAPLNLENEQGETPLDLADHQERFRESLDKQNADGDPEKLAKVKRPTQTTDTIKQLLAGKKDDSQ